MFIGSIRLPYHIICMRYLFINIFLLERTFNRDQFYREDIKKKKLKH